MGNAKIEKQKKWNNEKKLIRKESERSEKRNLQLLVDIGGGHHQTNDVRKKLRKTISGKRENYSEPNYSRHLKRINTEAVLLVR